jgi:hypothetical protein
MTVTGLMNLSSNGEAPFHCRSLVDTVELGIPQSCLPVRLGPSKNELWMAMLQHPSNFLLSVPAGAPSKSTPPAQENCTQWREYTHMSVNIELLSLFIVTSLDESSSDWFCEDYRRDKQGWSGNEYPPAAWQEKEPVTVSAQTKERKRKCTTILFCRLPLWGTVRNVFTNVVFLMHTISMELEVAESVTSSE